MILCAIFVHQPLSLSDGTYAPFYVLQYVLSIPSEI